MNYHLPKFYFGKQKQFQISIYYLELIKRSQKNRKEISKHFTPKYESEKCQFISKKKALLSSRENRIGMIDKLLSLITSKQCDLLSIHRGRLYYKPIN